MFNHQKILLPNVKKMSRTKKLAHGLEKRMIQPFNPALFRNFFKESAGDNDMKAFCTLVFGSSYLTKFLCGEFRKLADEFRTEKHNKQKVLEKIIEFMEFRCGDDSAESAESADESSSAENNFSSDSEDQTAKLHKIAERADASNAFEKFIGRINKIIGGEDVFRIVRKANYEKRFFTCEEVSQFFHLRSGKPELGFIDCLLVHSSLEDIKENMGTAVVYRKFLYRLVGIIYKKKDNTWFTLMSQWYKKIKKTLRKRLYAIKKCYAEPPTPREAHKFFGMDGQNHKVKDEDVYAFYYRQVEDDSYPSSSRSPPPPSFDYGVPSLTWKDNSCAFDAAFAALFSYDFIFDRLLSLTSDRFPTSGSDGPCGEIIKKIKHTRSRKGTTTELLQDTLISMKECQLKPKMDFQNISSVIECMTVYLHPKPKLLHLTVKTLSKIRERGLSPVFLVKNEKKPCVDIFSTKPKPKSAKSATPLESSAEKSAKSVKSVKSAKPGDGSIRGQHVWIAIIVQVASDAKKPKELNHFVTVLNISCPLQNYDCFMFIDYIKNKESEKYKYYTRQQVHRLVAQSPCHFYYECLEKNTSHLPDSVKLT